MDLNLKGKTAIVTGGGGGLGAGISEILAQEGVNVVVNYLFDEENVFKFVDYLNAKYEARAVAMQGDISIGSDIDNIIKNASCIYGSLDILVNNAGIWPTTPLTEMKDEEWERVIRINLNGPYFFSKRFVDYLLRAGKTGNIVNVTSKSGFAVNSAGHAHYASAKGGINLMTKSFAREYSDKGIIVNAIIPGMVRTPLNIKTLSDPELEKKYLERIPVGKMSDPKDIGAMVAFLVSDKSYITAGSLIDVTGGMLI